jgi:hypothetical protein
MNRLHSPACKTRVLTWCVLVLTLIGPAGQLSADDGSDRPGVAMATAARQLSESLSPELQKKLSYSYDDPERLNWHFIPRERNGIAFWDLDGPARAAADNLVRTGLSAAGYDKTLQVRSLEEVLYLFEEGEEPYRRQRRHPHKYHLTIFGQPGPTGLWGWRFEGHHLSLNFSIRDGVVVSSTPEFFGANPGLIEGGPGRSLRVLGRREDLAREILKSCTESQRQQMWISTTAPDEIRGPGAPQAVVEDPVGLRYADMSPDQQKLLKELIAEYMSAMPAQVVRDRMKGISDHGLDDIRIGWWGEPERNQRHHYVVQGPTFIIEYNNTQNEANHVHAMWRSLSGDFDIPVTPAK